MYLVHNNCKTVMHQPQVYHLMDNNLLFNVSSRNETLLILNKKYE